MKLRVELHVSELLGTIRSAVSLLPDEDRREVLSRAARALQALADEPSKTPSGFLRATKILEQAMEENQS